MKSNRGVTITGLVIYIASFFLVCGIIAGITTFFYNNSKILSDQASSSTDYDILNAYLSKEITESNNTILNIDSENNLFIEFSNGNKYEFDATNKLLYFINDEKCFVLCDNLEECAFKSISDGFELNVKATSGQEFNQEYYISE